MSRKKNNPKQWIIFNCNYAVSKIIQQQFYCSRMQTHNIQTDKKIQKSQKITKTTTTHIKTAAT